MEYDAYFSNLDNKKVDNQNVKTIKFPMFKFTVTLLKKGEDYFSSNFDLLYEGKFKFIIYS